MGIAVLVAVSRNDTGSPSTAGEGPASSAADRPDATTSPTHRVAFVGDSWTVGVGSPSGRGYAVLAGEQLGWEYEALGISGSGYLRGPRFAERIMAAAETGADVVVLQGSLNDSDQDLQALGPAARDTIAGLRAAVDPSTVVLVVGAPSTPGTDRARIDAINVALAAAAADVGVRFVDPVAENWTDPADPTIWADPIHPNDAGHQLIADRMTALLRESVPG